MQSADLSRVDTLGLTPARPQPNWFARIFWPSLRDEAEVHDAARHGYFACLFLCACTLVLMLMGGSPLAAMIDVCFFSMAALGVRQLSRLASVAAFIMVLAERAAALVGGQVGALSVLGILIAAILLNSIRAAYAAHDMRPGGDVGTIPNPPFLANHEAAGWLETLPWILWPMVRIAFKFYLVGLMVMMLVGVLVRKVGLME